ncbi:MAG TPA: hypothetical protein VFN22_09860 [Gemmatimonadales bacterium]|nr:hypothetical protein [Gemmatimonadales bacterium]
MSHPSAARESPPRPASPTEGIVVGMIGASVVALFFLGIDLVRGTPLLTPSILGEVFVLRRPVAVTSSVDMTAVVAYTVVHLLAFGMFGLVLDGIRRRSEVSSLARYGMVAVFVAFELFFFGLLAIASEATQGMFPSWSVLVANLLAATAMGGYLWRRHPALRRAVGRAPLGAPDRARE